jgi:hypothetical protein
MHIPFIVKHAGQTSRGDVVDDLRAEELLRDTVAGTCLP